MKKSIMKLAFLAIFYLFAACSSGGNDVNYEEYHDETGMYLGITMFSEYVQYYPDYYYRYDVLTDYNARDYKNFINSSSMGGATILYYAVDDALAYLEKCSFPEDVNSVSVITFTDGLDQGSRAYNDQYKNNAEYVAAIEKKIKTIRVNGLPVNAYTIGVRGSDVTGDAVIDFQNNLRSLASSEENAIEVANIDEVTDKFKEIAASLYNKSEIYNLTITIPMPDENERQRFTFDNVTDAEQSACYLEGVYVNNALTEIEYKGCKSTSGTKVSVSDKNGVMLSFEFENFTNLNGTAIPTNNMQQWRKKEGQTTWIRNSEFKPSESIVTKEDRKSAVVALILDCSSSLGNDFEKVQQAACDFVQTLVGGSEDSNGNNNNDDDGNIGNEETQPDVAYLRYYKEEPYLYWIAMGYYTETSDIVDYHEFGTDAGVSPYYEIPAGVVYPVIYYYDEEYPTENGWYYTEGLESYNFLKGRKYTYTLTDNGNYVYGYITLDGYMNAPAHFNVQKERKIRKGDIKRTYPMKSVDMK